MSDRGRWLWGARTDLTVFGGSAVVFSSLADGGRGRGRPVLIAPSKAPSRTPSPVTCGSATA